MGLPYKKKEIIGDCTLYLGDCLKVMPLLDKVDSVVSVDNGNNDVVVSDYEQTASRKYKEGGRSEKTLGESQGGDCSALSGGGQVADASSSTLRNNLIGDSASIQEARNKKQNESERGGEERQIYTRQSNEALSWHDKERELRSLPDKRKSLHTPQGRQPLQQCEGESSGSLHVVSQQDAQARVVELPKGWAILTDPPYGIGADKGHTGASSFNGSKKIQHRSYKGGWDSERPSEAIQLFASIKCPQIIWGGNYFADLLPPMGKWLWWDKCQTMPTFGDGELAWSNLSGTTPKKFVLSNNKIVADRTERFHPTQKPLPLMKWCIEQLPKDTQTILDPFMGSGTTLVACAKVGRKGIGIELDEDYFNIACKRVEEAYKSPDMFVEVEKKEKEQQKLI